MGREPPDSRPSTSTTCHVPQHILQDATVEVVQPFSRGVNAHDRVKLDDLIVDGLDVDRLRDHLVNLVNTGNLEGFLASQTEEAADWPSGNCSGRTPIPMRLERWMRS